MKQPRSPKRLSVEHLEDRLTPTFGVAWFDATSLTMSFVPDGTNISGKASNLFADLNGTTAQQTWQREILRAYQTWAVQANINIGLVADGGQAMGAVGAPQEDVRFGDIRIGGRSLSGGNSGDNMAGTVGFDYSIGTWAGDSVFNTDYTFGIGDIPSQDQRDLFSVMLHEAGHSFGLADGSDHSSVMDHNYQVWTSLSASDVAALRALYGARQADAYEGTTGNNTLATAYNLTTNGNKIAIDGDITQAGDVDYYSFTTPAATSGATGLTVNLKAAGISLLTARITVLDAAGNVVGSAVSTDPTSNDLSVAIPNYQPGTTYRIKVEGSGTDVFSIGAYVLRLSYANYAGGANADVTNHYFANRETSANDAISAAQTLAPVQSQKANTFAINGTIANASDADWYKITPNAPVGFTGTLYIGVLGASAGLHSNVSIYSATGQLLPSSVVMNESGVMEVQLAGQATGTTYFVRVGSGDTSTGGYRMLATLAPSNASSFRNLNSSTITDSSTTVYSTMKVDGNRLSQFSLAASTGTTTAEVGVRVTIFDSTGHAIFSKSVKAGDPLVTGEVWLPCGTFTVAFNAATKDGSALPSVNFDFSIRELSDPIDPIPVNPLTPPPVDQPISLPPPVVTPPPGPIVDPIKNPFAGP